MCRSKSQGGRRCAGHSGTTAAGTGTATPATSTAGAVPSREQTDRLAAQLPADRTGWDGSPLDDTGRRLYALRESGYTGPINQDGYPETTGDAADTLRHMARMRGESVTW